MRLVAGAVGEEEDGWGGGGGDGGWVGEGRKKMKVGEKIKK